MRRPRLDVTRVTVRATPVYTCRECGREGRGDAVTLQAASYAEAFRNPVVSNSHMPVGWAGYGLYEHACPEHVR